MRRTGLFVTITIILSILFSAIPAKSQVKSNAFVSPCINTTVIDPKTGKNLCVTNANGQNVFVGTQSPLGNIGIGALSVSGATFAPATIDVGWLSAGHVTLSSGSIA